MPTSYNFNLIDNDADTYTDVRVMSAVTDTVTNAATNAYTFANQGVEEIVITGTSGPVWFWPVTETKTAAEATTEYAKRTTDNQCGFMFTAATGLASSGAGAIATVGPFKRPIVQIWVVSDSGSQTVTVQGMNTVATE